MKKYYIITMFQERFQMFVLIFVDIILISLKCSYGQRLAVSPCIDMKAINWIRDANHCDHYFICHFGQPLSMPACPKGQVWSNTALNCVPQNSRWDDCSSENDTPRNNQNKGSSKSHSKVTERSQLKTYNISLKDDHPKGKKKRLKNTMVWHRYGNTRLPTEMPLFTPKAPTKFWVTENNLYEKTVHDPFYRNTPSYPVTRPTPSVMQKITKRTRTIWKKGTRKNYGRYRTTQNAWRKDSNNVTPLQNSLTFDSICYTNPGALLPHPTNCHWYYNCSLANLDGTSSSSDDVDETNYDDNRTRTGFMRLRPFRVLSAGVFVWECRYPQLFDDVTYTCREFVNVRCGSRFEPVDQCEYSQRQCHSGRCDSCDKRFGRCRGRENGIYPIQATQWSPVFMTCYQSRNIAQDQCKPPKPVFSPDKMDCVSLFEVPKVNGGLLPDCSSRPDGYYPDEQGRCAIFFRCSLGKFRGYDECPPASVFDPSIPACQPYSVSSLPCGEGQAPLCGGRSDGMYADPYGRCTHFFQCANGVFQRYYSCDEGIFDPLTQTCIISAAQTLRPCGLKSSPCETLPTGVYPDQGTHCRNFIECHQGIIITNGTCDRGLVFSAISGRCDVPENTPPPCGVASTCLGRPDGRYPALNRGCSFFYECYHGEFISLRRCTAADGGFFFNPANGRCDYPQNICPPCGHRWWGCAQQYKK